MAIQDQCNRCSNYTGSSCRLYNSYPSFNQTSCEGYNRNSINLDKGNSARPAGPSQPISTPRPTPPSQGNSYSSYGGSNYGGNNNYSGGNNNGGSATNGRQGTFSQESFFDSLLSFSGRSRRSRYWLTSFFCSGIVFAFMIMGAILTGGDEGGVAFGYILGAIPCLGISIANGTKRLHDLGHNGWLQLLLLIPMINVGMGIYMAFFEGQRFDNQYGPSPY